MRTMLLAAVLLGSGFAPVVRAEDPQADVELDDFEDLSPWSAHPADGVLLNLVPDAGRHGSALRLDFDFQGGGGYAVARRDLDVALPGNYAFSFHLRGRSPVNTLEFKLLDASGENVWWYVWRDLEFPEDWTRFAVRRNRITFAWGPLGGGELDRVAAVEIAITAGTGGKGSVWIDDFVLRPLPPPDAEPPAPSLSASSASPEASRCMDGDFSTAWSPGEPGEAWVNLDLGTLREFGGLVIDWLPGRRPEGYQVEDSDDGTGWRSLRTVRDGAGKRDYLYLPDSEARFVRIRMTGGSPALAEISLQPLAWSATREDFFTAIAADAPRGTYPRGFSGEQAYWTVVGGDGDREVLLFSEDGAMETHVGNVALEPFLRTGDRLWTWNDVETSQTLEGGYLPIPTVRWGTEEFSLEVTPLAPRASDASATLLRYRVSNLSRERRQLTLYLAVRPFQVNPPTQFLNRRGGTTPVRSLSAPGDGTVRINRRVAVTSEAPFEFGAVPFDGGDIVGAFLSRGELPTEASAEDGFEAASGALAFSLDLGPGETREVHLALPRDDRVHAAADFDEALIAGARAWRRDLDKIEIRLPASQAHLEASIRSQLAYVLVNRAGAGIQPGTRSYARSWIRDGSLTGAALLRWGLDRPVREFLAWFAPHQYANGKIPCVVDHRGADPVPEHDSNGEFIFLVAELYRYTHDRELADAYYPRVARAAAYLDSLRQSTRIEANRADATTMFFGLLPPSISHEGYSAKPMHSYWDDFFALRGFRDALFLARELDRPEDARRWQAILEQFETELAASVETAVAWHGIDYVPGCADLGDFDATSTTIAFDPTGAEDILPSRLLAATFDRYYAFFVGRRGGDPWEALTPYEVRNIGALVRQGRRAEALEVMSYFLDLQRPPGWRQWPEVVRSGLRTPGFLGDLPHSWVGSDFVRSALDLFAYESVDRGTLVLGAGIPLEWLESAPEVGIRNLATTGGHLDFGMRLVGDTVTVRVDGDLMVPRGGIRVHVPLERPGLISVNGVATKPEADGSIPVDSIPATVTVTR